MCSDRDIKEGEARYSERKYEEALEIARASGNGDWPAYNLEGRCLLRLKRYDEAAKALEKACAFKPPVDVWLNLSSALSAGKNYEKAYAHLQRAGEKHFNDLKIDMAKVKLLRKWGKKRLALTVCENTTMKFPLSLESWEARLTLSASLGEHVSKNRSAMAILEMKKDHPKALRAAAECSIHERRFPDAKDIASKYASIEPDKPVGWLLLSETAHGMKMPEEAMAYVDRALHLNQKYTYALVQRSILLVEREDEEEARKVFSRALELNPAIAQKKLLENQRLDALMSAV